MVEFFFHSWACISRYLGIYNIHAVLHIDISLAHLYSFISSLLGELPIFFDFSLSYNLQCAHFITLHT